MFSYYKKLLSGVSLAGLVLLSPCAIGSQIKTMSSFSTIEKWIVKQHFNPKSTLVIFDNDDTLTRLACHDKQCQYLGGPSWFPVALQKAQAEQKKHPNKPIVKNFVTDNILLIALTQSQLVEPHAERQLLGYLSQKGYPQIVETARPPQMANATEMAFDHLHIMQHFIQSGVKFNGLASLPYPIHFPGYQDSLRYEQGVLYNGAMNKGYALQDLLKKSNQHFKNFVFVDDTMKNIQVMAKAFKHQNMTAIYFTHLKHFKNQYQAKAQQQSHARMTHLQSCLAKNLTQSTWTPMTS